jgi:hypothetical protein
MLALLGDNPSGREAVVPLERAGDFGFGTQDSAPGSPTGPTVAIATANFYDGTDADLVAQKLYASMAARRAA